MTTVDLVDFIIVPSGLISFVINCFLGVFVYLHNPRSSLNRFFAIFALSIGFWSVGSSLENLIADEPTALRVLRLCYLSAAFLPTLFLHFTYVLTRQPAHRRAYLWLAYAMSGIFALLTWTPYFIQGLRVIEPYRFRVSDPGKAYDVFFAFFCVSMFTGLAWIVQRTRQVSGNERRQLQYIFLSHVIAVIAGLEYFLRIFRVTEFPPIDDYILLVYFLVFAYAVIRHQVMDIKVAITRTGVLLTTYLIVLGAPFAVGWWGRGWLEQQFAEQWWVVPLGLCTALATAGPFAYAYLRRQAEARLLKEQRRYQRLLQHAARGMTRVRNVTVLAKLIVKVVSRSVRVEHASMFLLDTEGRRYTLVASHGPKRFAMQSRYGIDANHPLIQWLLAHQTVLSHEEVLQIPRLAVTQELRDLASTLVVPGFIERKLIGVLMLGSKLSGEDYSADDLHAFSTLANEAAVAIDNARSYEELKKVNEQLRLAYDRLVTQERLVAAGQFATGMAHEIKNPLSAIKTFAEYLPEKYKDPSFREKFFRIVQSEIDRINTLVKELSDFARPAPPQLQPVAISALMADVLSLLSTQCMKQGVEVVNGFKENGLLIQVDPQQIKQVLLNLILNSLEAMSGGGRLEITSRVAEERLWLQVKDTGCGIPPEHHGKLWDPFFTTKERGMGLGLAIVRGIIERHGGSITLRSQVGRGTTVELNLPVVSS